MNTIPEETETQEDEALETEQEIMKRQVELIIARENTTKPATNKTTKT
jgi:hypothetical protein